MGRPVSDAVLLELRNWLAGCGVMADDVSDEDMQKLAHSLPVLFRQDNHEVLVLSPTVVAASIRHLYGGGANVAVTVDGYVRAGDWQGPALMQLP